MFHSKLNKFQVDFLCCFYLLLKQNLSDQIETGVFGIGLITRFFRDGLRWGGCSRNERMEAAVVIKDEAWWQRAELTVQIVLHSCTSQVEA